MKLPIKLYALTDYDCAFRQGDLCEITEIQYGIFPGDYYAIGHCNGKSFTCNIYRFGILKENAEPHAKESYEASLRAAADSVP